MATQNNQQGIKILIALIFIGAIACVFYQQRTPRHNHPAPHRLAKVHHLQNGGYCYNNGNDWWYYQTAFTDSGAAYSPTANTWQESSKSPAANNLRINAVADASDPQEVEINSQGQPEQGAMTEAEVSEMEGQVNDMVNEGNPNNQEMAGNEGESAGSEGGGESGDGGGSSGGDSGGGGDGGGGGDSGGD